jgi:hypothetical protein
MPCAHIRPSLLQIAIPAKNRTEFWAAADGFLEIDRLTLVSDEPKIRLSIF